MVHLYVGAPAGYPWQNNDDGRPKSINIYTTSFFDLQNGMSWYCFHTHGAPMQLDHAKSKYNCVRLDELGWILSVPPQKSLTNSWASQKKSRTNQLYTKAEKRDAFVSAKGKRGKFCKRKRAKGEVNVTRQDLLHGCKWFARRSIFSNIIKCIALCHQNCFLHMGELIIFPILSLEEMKLVATKRYQKHTIGDGRVGSISQRIFWRQNTTSQIQLLAKYNFTKYNFLQDTTFPGR